MVGSSSLMFGFAGEMRYDANRIGRFGDTVKIDFATSFFTGMFKMGAADENAGTIHALSNKRPDYQSMDSYEDLLARDKWKSEWFDKFTGSLYLSCPRGVPGVPRELTRVTTACSWASAFCVVEYCLGDAFYQFSRRPPRGRIAGPGRMWRDMFGRFASHRPRMNRSVVPMPRPLHTSRPSHRPRSKHHHHQ